MGEFHATTVRVQIIMNSEAVDAEWACAALESQAYAHNSESKWKNHADEIGEGKWKCCIWAMQKSSRSGAGIKNKEV